MARSWLEGVRAVFLTPEEEDEKWENPWGVPTAQAITQCQGEGKEGTLETMELESDLGEKPGANERVGGQGPCKADHFFKALDSRRLAAELQGDGTVKAALTISRTPEMLEEEIEVLESRRVDSIALLQKDSSSELLCALVWVVHCTV